MLIRTTTVAVTSFEHRQLYPEWVLIQTETYTSDFFLVLQAVKTLETLDLLGHSMYNPMATVTGCDFEI